MTDWAKVYHKVDSKLSSRETADSVIRLCANGDVASARALLVEGDDPDLLLARGIVEYWAARATDGDYETAKDTLGRSGRSFASQGNKRSHLADIWLGLCYWRQGQSPEAFIVMGNAAVSDDPGTRFLARLNLSVIQIDHRCWQDTLHSLNVVADLVDTDACSFLRGQFFQQRGLAYKVAYEETRSADFLDKALIDYDTAGDHFETEGNARYEAAILNNVANLRREIGDYDRAHNSADRAASLYERIGDRSCLGHVRDTKALILCDQGQYQRAKRYADQSVGLLQSEPSYLSRSLVTRARILYHLKRPQNAFADFQSAIRIAEDAGDMNTMASACFATIHTMSTHLSASLLAEIYRKGVDVDPDRKSHLAVAIINRLLQEQVTSLDELKAGDVKHEREIILKALESTSGSVTRAAKLLGKTHGGLAHIIRTRHPDLLKNRRPVISRRKRS